MKHNCEGCPCSNSCKDNKKVKHNKLIGLIVFIIAFIVFIIYFLINA